MKKFLVFIFILGFVFILVNLSSSAIGFVIDGIDSLVYRQMVEDGIIIVKFNTDTTEEELIEFSRKYNVDFTRPIDKYRTYSLILPSDVDKSLISSIKDEAIVDFIFRNYQLENSSQYSDTIDRFLGNRVNRLIFESIGLTDAIDYLINIECDTDVVIAISEYTGYAEFLINELKERGYFLVEPDNGITEIEDVEKQEHGTQVLSFFAALSQGSQIVKILPLKYDGRMSSLTDSMADAGRIAEENNARLVINISTTLSLSAYKSVWENNLINALEYPDNADTKQLAHAIASVEFTKLQLGNPFEEFAQENVLVAAGGNNNLDEVKRAYLKYIGLKDEDINNILNLTDEDEISNALENMSKFTDEEIQGYMELVAQGVSDEKVYPAFSSGAISVGEISQHGVIQFPYSAVDIYVPSRGVHILNPDGSIIIKSGTSFGANIVSFVAGLILKIDSDFKPSEVKDIISESSEKFYDEGLEAYARSLNALSAVKTANVYSGIKSLKEAILNVSEDDFNTSLEKIFYNNPEILIEHRELFDSIFKDFKDNILTQVQAISRIDLTLADMFSYARENDINCLASAIAIDINRTGDSQALERILENTGLGLDIYEINKIIDSSNINTEVALETAYVYTGLKQLISALDNDGDVSRAFGILKEQFPEVFSDFNLGIEDDVYSLDKKLWELAQLEIQNAILIDISINQDRDRLVNILRYSHENLSEREIDVIISNAENTIGEFDASRVVQIANSFNILKDIFESFQVLSEVFSDEVKEVCQEFWRIFLESGYSEAQLNDALFRSLILGITVGAEKLDNISGSVTLDEKLNLIYTEEQVILNLLSLFGENKVPQSVLGEFSIGGTELEIGIISPEEAFCRLMDEIVKYSDIIPEVEIANRVWIDLQIPFSDLPVLDSIIETELELEQKENIPILNSINPHDNFLIPF